jgi:hypothetical protein
MDKWREDVYTWCKVHVVRGVRCAQVSRVLSPLYFDVPSNLLISTITVQLCMIPTAPLDSRTNSDLEPGRGMDSETASDGCSGLYIPLLDAPQVSPLIIPQWRRPDQVTVPHDATIPPADFNQNIS